MKVTVTVIALLFVVSFISFQNKSFFSELSNNHRLPAQASSSDTKVTPLEFRDIFLSIAANDYTPVEFEKAQQSLIFYPPSELQDNMIVNVDASSPQEFLLKQKQLFSRFSSLDFVSQAHKTPASPQRINPQQIENTLKQTPITIVIFPGIFGEFIKNRAYNEVFENSNSKHFLKWKKMFEPKPICNTDNEDSKFCDIRYDTEALSETPTSMFDLLSVSSVDNAQGEPLFNVVLFNTQLMSLESLGRSEFNAKNFLRRLEKYFEIMGEVSPNIIFMGYSLGTVTGLEALSQVQAQAKPWAKNIKGMVAMAGVTYGTELADTATTPPQPNQKPEASYLKLKYLSDLAESLRDEAPPGQEKKVRGENYKLWAKFAVQMYNLRDEAADSPAPSNPGSGGIDLPRIDRISAGSLFDIAVFTAFRSFNLGNFFEDHFKNVKRFKKFTAQTLIAINEMTTKSRIQWWGTHLIPYEGLRYYSVTATMTDPLANLDLANSPYTFNSTSLDDRILLKSFYDLRRVSANALNDSQMALYSVRFWPEAAKIFNPNQKEFKTTYLGTFGTHHWGLTLKRVSNENPFPRIALLKSVAASAALDISRQANQ